MVEVHCERCGTSYSFDESRLGEDGARVRCARCGHVFLVPKTEPGDPGPSRAALGDSLRREWRVRRRDGSVSVLKELTTLQRWIVERTLSREDEIGLDGETWRVLGTIPDLGPFFAAADARAQVALLEKEVAGLRAQLAAAPQTPLFPPAVPPSSAEAGRPRAPTLSSLSPAQSSTPPLSRALPPASRASPYTEGPGPSEPAFTRTAGGLGVPATDDWEPPRLGRGLGAWVVVVLLLLVLAALGTAGYFYVWLPERERARAEQARNSQLEHDQAEREARLKAAEQRAKEELLQALAAAQAHDAGALPPDGGSPPRGALEPPPPPAAVPPPAEVRVPVPTLATGPNNPPRQPAKANVEASSGAAPEAPRLLNGSPQSFEDWMAEADRRRTHERASSALAAYDRALALQPQRSDAHAGRGLALLDLGRRPEALGEFQRALELDPRDGVAVLGLAETYRSLGRTEEARRAYRRYLEGWPEGPEATAARAALESLKE